MKRQLLFFLFVFLSLVIQAQENPERFKVKTGASFHRSTLWVGTFAHVAGRISLNYSVSNYLEVGAYGAYSQYKSNYEPTWDTPLVSYGMEFNYHFLNHFNTEEVRSWDVYISGKLGGYYAFIPETMPGITVKHRLDYGAYLGVAYSFSNYFTPYIEIGYGELSIIELGLSFSF